MSVVGILIISSFFLLALAIAAIAVDSFTGGKYAFLSKKYYWIGVLSGLFYLAGSLVLFFDGTIWNRFKYEVSIILGIYVLTLISFPLASRKKQALIHYLLVLILAVVFSIMNIKWCGFLR
ncbi:MAG: hypothetical protein WC310_04310 [Patescibacteria group bacterium]|jgi:uncharacterized membrane protein